MSTFSFNKTDPVNHLYSDTIICAKSISLRIASINDVDALTQIETICFQTDRLNPRRIKHWIEANNALFMVACDEAHNVIAYTLMITRKGSRSARLYSIAVLPSQAGKGVAKKLIETNEKWVIDRGLLFVRLEVAVTNIPAISLYNKLGFKQFGMLASYYDDGSDALRLQKSVRQCWKRQNQKNVDINASNDLQNSSLLAYPWYQQTTDFTCGAASLMMAMKSLNSTLVLDQSLELDIWRKATTIYMTSGHGGTHPIGLALYAQELGFKTEAYLSTKQPLFLDGVRSQHKKQILQQVNRDFMALARKTGLAIYEDVLSIDQIRLRLESGDAILGLISTYQFDGKKAPHWVCITHVDDVCLYLHDPDADVLDAQQKISPGKAQVPEQTHMDFQHIPIALDDYERLSSFGKKKLRSTLILSYKTNSFRQRS